MKTFIFDENLENWKEEDKNLLLHDLAIFLDEKNKILFLWTGPKSKKKKEELGLKSLSLIKEKYEGFELKILKDDIPSEIHKQLMNLLRKYGKQERKTLERIIYLKLFIIFGLFGIFFLLIYSVSLLISLTWVSINGSFQIDALIYDGWILTSQILILISLLFFIGSQILSFIIKDLLSIIIAFIGVIISIGLLIYISQGIFLFIFQLGSTPTMYLISQNDLFIFLLTNLIGIIVLVIPCLFNIVQLFKNSKVRREKEH